MSRNLHGMRHKVTATKALAVCFFLPCRLQHGLTWPTTGLETLAGLCELYAGGNPLATLRALRPLHPLQRLAALDLAACPLAALPDCRAHCLFHLSALQVLRPI